MELFSRQIIDSVLILALMSCCSTQTTLWNQQRNQILDEVLQSLGETTSNSTNLNGTSNIPDSSNVTDTPNNTDALNDTLVISVINKTLSEPSTDLPATIRVIIGFMATMKHSTGLRTITGSQQTSNRETYTSTGTRVMNTNRPTEATTEHMVTADTSSMKHIPDGQMVGAFAHSNQSDTLSHDGNTSPGEGDPIIEQKQENVSTEDQQGSLPLVLGAAIVVIFAAGVTGATIKAKLRKRKLAKKETLSTSRGSDVELERGLDNPAFTGEDKSNTDLSIMFNSHPRLEYQMKYTTPTMSMY